MTSQLIFVSTTDNQTTTGITDDPWRSSYHHIALGSHARHAHATTSLLSHSPSHFLPQTLHVALNSALASVHAMGEVHRERMEPLTVCAPQHYGNTVYSVLWSITCRCLRWARTLPFPAWPSSQPKYSRGLLLQDMWRTDST